MHSDKDTIKPAPAAVRANAAGAPLPVLALARSSTLSTGPLSGDRAEPALPAHHQWWPPTAPPPSSRSSHCPGLDGHGAQPSLLTSLARYLGRPPSQHLLAPNSPLLPVHSRSRAPRLCSSCLLLSSPSRPSSRHALPHPIATMEDSQIPQVNLKRKRSSPSLTLSTPLPPPKAVKTGSPVQINYLARRSPQDLPLIDKNERLPSIIDVLSAYTSVLDRHESLASNLGARPLGPILIKRFERCFDAPPQIITSHSHAKDTSDAPQVTWLEVIQFAQSHPGQFTLSNQVEGRPVCQFYYPQKQSRVQVSEEDYLFIKSGRCQDLIPPLPIWEDEEKEVGTCEILEKSLRELTHAADTVGARARQLAHRLKSRRMAIMERRAAETSGNGIVEHQNGGNDEVLPEVHAPPPMVTTGGSLFTMINGQNNAGPTADVTVRNDLLRHFQAKSQVQGASESGRRASSAHAAATSPPSYALPRDASPPTVPAAHSMPRPIDRPDVLSYYLSDTATPLPPVAVPSAQRESKHNFSRPLKPDAEMTQPFRAICQAHMESLGRGARVMPPCDRCRRLRMDCMKNLTSCQGCTKKHARCHWRDVERSEVEGLEGLVHERSGHDSGVENGGGSRSAAHSGSDQDNDESEDEGMGALEDLEALERQSEEEEAAAGPMDIDRKPSDVQPRVDSTSADPAAGSADQGTYAARSDVSDQAPSASSHQQPQAPAQGPPIVQHREQPQSQAPMAHSMGPPPPARPRQSSYGFPPSQSGSRDQHGHQSTPPLDTAASATKGPDKYVHVATPHPGHNSASGFTSVNASTFNAVVNGDSSIAQDGKVFHHSSGSSNGVGVSAVPANPSLPPTPKAWSAQPSGNNVAEPSREQQQQPSQQPQRNEDNAKGPDRHLELHLHDHHKERQAVQTGHDTSSSSTAPEQHGETKPTPSDAGDRGGWQLGQGIKEAAPAAPSAQQPHNPPKANGIITAPPTPAVALGGGGAANGAGQGMVAGSNAGAVGATHGWRGA